jgi:hypothetical protein
MVVLLAEGRTERSEQSERAGAKRTAVSGAGGGLRPPQNTNDSKNAQERVYLKKTLSHSPKVSKLASLEIL